MNPLQNYLNSLKKPKINIQNTPRSVGLTVGNPQMTNVANNPASTPAITPQITPATNTIASANNATNPARQQFTESLVSGSTPNTYMTGGATNPSPNLVGTTPVEKNQYDNFFGKVVPDEDSKAKDSFLNSYRDYLSNYTKVSQRLADIQNKTEQTQTDARRAYDARLDELGGLRAGAQDAARGLERRSNTELADLALRESAAARSLSAMKPIQIGDSYIDPVTGNIISEGTAKNTAAAAGFSLSPGEQRFDAEGNLIASGGPKPMSATQETAEIARTEKEQAAQEQASLSIGLINSILSSGSNISGIGQNPLNYVGLANSKTLNEYNQLKGMLKLGIRGLIKGQGAVSDYEGKILADASSALGRNLNDEDFDKALKQTRGVLKTNNGQITSVTVTNPETNESITENLSGPEIYQLVSEGNVITYN